MQRIVTTGLKIDLHIHSVESSKKDGSKVKNNTLSNIKTLVQKLNEQNVNICSITDHDTFSYAMYSTLKQVEQKENTIKKVLPGVEFSVCFKNSGNESVVHVVAIFSDEDDEKVFAIEKIIQENPPTYNGAYQEEDFLALLRHIDINTILIAHQKNTLSSGNVRKNDANTVGESKFWEFIYTDYFEALEFKNRRNEVINKNYLLQKHMEKKIRFVTGTDCHDWSVYPAETAEERLEEFPYTFAKCLPTFKGLVMAITDHNRLSRVNSFFTATRYTLPSVKITQDSNEIEIPLSKGINVVIGDNSVGKSLLLHALTGYSKPSKLLPVAVKNGYKKYLKQLNVDIKPQVADEHVFLFDMQGEIRQKFDENQLNATEFLRRYFPQSVNSAPYKAILENEINKMIEYLRKKFEIDEELKELSTFNIVINESNADSMTFINNIGYAKPKSDNVAHIVSQIDNILAPLAVLMEMKLDESDIEYIDSALKYFSIMKEKYEIKVKAIETESSRMETVSTIIKKISAKHNKGISDTQKKITAFTENTSRLKNQIIELIRQRQSLRPYVPTIPQTSIRVNINPVFEYEFVSKLGIDEINTEYFLMIISKVLKAGKKIDWETIREEELQDMVARYDGTSILEFFRNALIGLIDEDLKQKNSIINQGMDKYEEFSAGLNSKIYFDLLSYES